MTDTGSSSQTSADDAGHQRDVGPQTSFTDELWVSIAPIYAAILRHPFIAGLTDGSLPRERFEFYAVQDALYLREFARALAITGGRAPKDDWIIMLAEHAAGALRVERTLHEDFFREFDLSAQAVLATPPAPTNGCSGTWVTGASNGHSRTSRPRLGGQADEAGLPVLGRGRDRWHETATTWKPHDHIYHRTL